MTERRVPLVDHQPGRVPQVQAIGTGKSIARKNKKLNTILV